jgi:hypothetical protein
MGAFALTLPLLVEGRLEGQGPDLEKVKAALIAPALEGLRAASGAAGKAEREWKLQELWTALETDAAAPVPQPGRRAFLSSLRGELVKSLAASGGLAEAEAEGLVSGAIEQSRELRSRKLQGELKCWCESERWTRTLANCWEKCALPQRELIDGWLKEGYGDEEIVELMVQKAGTPEVKGVPTGTLPLLTLCLIVGGGCILVALVFRRVLRPRARSLAPSPSPEPRPASSADAEWEARLDQELKEMET